MFLFMRCNNYTMGGKRKRVILTDVKQNIIITRFTLVVSFNSSKILIKRTEKNVCFCMTVRQQVRGNGYTKKLFISSIIE